MYRTIRRRVLVAIMVFGLALICIEIALMREVGNAMIGAAICIAAGALLLIEVDGIRGRR